jgi:hypothetical protein
MTQARTISGKAILTADNIFPAAPMLRSRRVERPVGNPARIQLYQNADAVGAARFFSHADILRAVPEEGGITEPQ